MCLIIHRPEPTVVPRPYLEEGIDSNSDGWGIMFADSGRIRTYKGLDRKSFFKAAKRVGDRPSTIHFRWATHGAKDASNCHPFVLCGGRFALMHNGIISGLQEVDKRRSDTWHFATHVVEPILAQNPEWFDSDSFVPTIEKMIGRGNKIVFLRDDGATRIAGAAEGHVRDGVWYSNHGYLPWTPLHRRRPAVVTAESYPALRAHSRDSELVELDPMDVYDTPSRKGRYHWELDPDDVESLEDLAYLDAQDRETFVANYPELVSQLIAEAYGRGE